MGILKDLLLLVLLLTLCCGWGRWVLRKSGLPLPEDLEGHLYGVAAGLLLTAYGVLLLGYLGRLTPGFVLLLLAGYLLCGWPEIRKLGRALSEGWRSLLDFPSRVPGICVGLVILSATFTLLFNHVPPTEGDERIYHMAFPQLYAAAHRIVERPDNWCSYYPQTGEMIFTLGMLLGGPGLARLWSWGFLGLASLAVFSLARRWFIGMGTSRVPWGALALYYSMPLCVTISGSAFPDQWMVFCGLMAACALSRWEESGFRSCWIYAAGFFTGAGLSARYTGLGMLFAILVAAGVLWLRSPARPPIRSLLLQLTGWALLAALTASPWWVRNAILTGNPLYPQRIIPGLPYNDLFQYWFRDCNAGGSGKEGMGTLRYWIEVFHGLIFGNLTLGAGPFPLLSLPVLLFYRPWPRAVSMAGIMAGTCFLFTSCLLLPLPARYQIFAFPFLALLSAYAIDKTLAATRSFPRGRTALCIVLLLPVLFPHLALPVYFGGSRIPFHLGWLSEEKYLERKLDDESETYPVMRFIREKVPPGSVLILGGQGYQYGYLRHTLLAMGAYPMDFWRGGLRGGGGLLRHPRPFYAVCHCGIQDAGASERNRYSFLPR